MTRIILVLGLLFAAAPTWALDPDEMFADPAKEQAARDIARTLRCVVCQNQSIFDSNAAVARDMRRAVRERMELGENEDEIVDYIVERFGDYVLLKPRVNGETLVLWAAPLALLILGGLAVAGYVRGRARHADPQTLSDQDRAEARALLGENT